MLLAGTGSRGSVAVLPTFTTFALWRADRHAWAGLPRSKIVVVAGTARLANGGGKAVLVRDILQAIRVDEAAAGGTLGRRFGGGGG
jgi:hypothetical protein